MIRARPKIMLNDTDEMHKALVHRFSVFGLGLGPGGLGGLGPGGLGPGGLGPGGLGPGGLGPGGLGPGGLGLGVGMAEQYQTGQRM